MGTNNRKGLYQSVTLRGRPPVWIADARIQTSVRNHLLSVEYEVFNSGRETVRARVGAEVLPNAGGAAVLSLPSQEIELPGFVTTPVKFSAPFGRGVALWQPDHPALYNLQTTLLNASGAELARTTTRFGFREVWFEGIHFCLNGIRCNLRGESPAYSEKGDMFATREGAIRMVQAFQKANFNVLRFHSMPAPPLVLEVCDELGMLVIDESAIYASWGMLMPENPRWMDFCRDHLARWVRRGRNHPAVVLWSAENEGLNVRALSPAMLAEFRRIIDASDGSRPVTFDGDGTAFGASQASNKHYVSTIADLKERGGKASGYGHDLRNDIYWALEEKQEVPLGCGEFLYPNERPMRGKERDTAHMMGLQTRGYRLANWYDIRPYNPSFIGFLRKEGTRPGYEEAYEVIVKSFAPIAVFDKDYDALGPYPVQPKLKAGEAARRTLFVYNDAFADDAVEVAWRAVAGEREVGGGRSVLKIPLGFHTTLGIDFTPGQAGELRLELASFKGGKEQFRDVRKFIVE
jgi:hypothetical protein